MINLDKNQQNTFERMLMVGIVKTLKDEGMLSDVQLNSAILKIQEQKTCTSKKIAV